MPGKRRRALCSSLWQASCGAEQQQPDFGGLLRCGQAQLQQPEQLPCSLPFAQALQHLHRQAQANGWVPCKGGQQQAGSSRQQASDEHQEEVTVTREVLPAQPQAATSAVGSGLNLDQASTSRDALAAFVCARSQLLSRLTGLKEELKAAERMVASLQGMVAEVEGELERADQQLQQRRQGVQGTGADESCQAEALLPNMIEILDSESEDVDGDVLLLTQRPC